MLILESINDSNFEHYKEFDEAFERDLCAFQSRIYPAENGEALLWYYIKFGETYIGSVWLEKYKPTDDYAVLGVFIAYEEYRSRGLGLKAVKAVINKACMLGTSEIRLRVRTNNLRAILCYQHAGFIETRTFEKKNGVLVTEMIYKI